MYYYIFIRFSTLIFILLCIISHTLSLPNKLCDQTPPQATVLTPSETNDLFELTIENADRKGDKFTFTPDQTYVLTIKALNIARPFVWFMITAEEDPDDENAGDFTREPVDAGSLKTLDTNGNSRYSERCAKSVENADNTFKNKVQIHWVSPKKSSKIRIRAMVAENSELWYQDDKLIVSLERDDQKPRDSPPYPIKDVCELCSEARYEVIFNGQWSRISHPRHYPSKPDENGYSHMVGCTHASSYTMWEQGSRASPGMKKLAEEADPTVLEREIIDNMSLTEGTRTLIKGRRRHHPLMMKPSHSLFRVDRIHHLFSIAVALRPSPDWFVGTSKFELCTDNGWLDYFTLPLYPWDAGTMDGVSYESHKSVTQLVSNVERVEVGSFNKESPFYQMNLNDLKPFAILQVRRLDVYPLKGEDCSENNEEEETGEAEEKAGEENSENEESEEPILAELRQDQPNCESYVWSEWTSCRALNGRCGLGVKTRTKRLREFYRKDTNYDDLQVRPLLDCNNDKDETQQSEYCFIKC